MADQLLREVLRAKRERGDADADEFKRIIVHDFAAGLNASVRGSINAYRQWLAKADRLGWPVCKVASRKAVLAELEVIDAGAEELPAAA